MEVKRDRKRNWQKQLAVGNKNRWQMREMEVMKKIAIEMVSRISSCLFMEKWFFNEEVTTIANKLLPLEHEQNGKIERELKKKNGDNR